MDGERDVVRQHADGFQVLGKVRVVAGAASESDHAHQASADPQRRDALEQFGRDVAVGTQVQLPRLAGDGDGRLHIGKRVHVLGKQRDHGLVGEVGEAPGGQRGHDRGLVAEKEERAFARIRRVENGGKNAAGTFGEIGIGGHFRAEFRQGLKREQKPSKVFVLGRHSSWPAGASRATGGLQAVQESQSRMRVPRWERYRSRRRY